VQSGERYTRREHGCDRATVRMSQVKRRHIRIIAVQYDVTSTFQAAFRYVGGRS
jgi:hypothetical protein